MTTAANPVTEPRQLRLVPRAQEAEKVSAQIVFVKPDHRFGQIKTADGQPAVIHQRERVELYLRGAELFCRPAPEQILPDPGTQVVCRYLAPPLPGKKHPRAMQWAPADEVSKMEAAAAKASETLMRKAEEELKRQAARKGWILEHRSPSKGERQGKKKGKKR